MKRNFKRYSKDERKRLSLDEIPSTVYVVDRDLRQMEREELPINHGEQPTSGEGGE